jgi:hypothetical protein
MGHIPFLQAQFALSAEQQHELHLESGDRVLRNETEQLELRTRHSQIYSSFGLTCLDLRIIIKGRLHIM